MNGIRRSGLVGRLSGKTLAPGPLSGETDEKTIDRASQVLNGYFEQLRSANPTRWEAGRDSSVATNPGLRAHLAVIAEAISYLAHKKSLDFYLMKPSEVSYRVTTFCKPIFAYLGGASDDEIRKRFSRKFGEGGVKEYTYELLKILAEANPDFGPEEFQRWVEQTDSERIDEINQFLMKLAERLTN